MHSEHIEHKLRPAGPHLRFAVERLGVLMTPDPSDPCEIEGVLNPAGIVGPDGHYYLFPRLVAAGNYSRIGVARVTRDAGGRPVGVTRLGLALEPAAPYECVGLGRGGCEDPRVTFLPDAGTFAMAYTALGPDGAHVALALSPDLRAWTRRGLVDFAPERCHFVQLHVVIVGSYLAPRLHVMVPSAFPSVK